MKGFGIAILLISLFHLASGADSNSNSKSKELNRILASVDGEPITWVDLYSRGGSLEDLINRKLILKAFKELKVEIREDQIERAVENFVQRQFRGDRDSFLTELKLQGITFDRFKEIQEERIALLALQPLYWSDEDEFVTEEEKASTYQMMVDKYAEDETVQIQSISIPKNEDFGPHSPKVVIDNLHAELSQEPAETLGAKFIEITRRSREKDGKDRLAKNNGEVVGLDGKSLKPEILSERVRKQVAALQPNQVSPVFDDGILWKIVYLKKREIPRPPDRDTIEDKIEQQALALKLKRKQESFLRKVRKATDVQLFE